MNNEYRNENKPESTWIGKNVISARPIKDDYVLVTSAEIRGDPSSIYLTETGIKAKQCIVRLGLQRISDGLESVFEEKVDVERINMFIENATAPENGKKIAQLKGNYLNAYYDGKEVIQLRIEMYADAENKN